LLWLEIGKDHRVQTVTEVEEYEAMRDLAKQIVEEKKKLRKNK
jgi:hypothetical protein